MSDGTTTRPTQSFGQSWSAMIIALLIFLNIVNYGLEFKVMFPPADSVYDSLSLESIARGVLNKNNTEDDDCVSFTKKTKKFAFEPTDAQEILDLVDSTYNYTCPEGLVLVKDKIHPSFYEYPHRKIPKVIHFTSKTRCMTPKFADNLLNRWGGLDGHSIFLHDDVAVEKLLSRSFKEFPHLQDGMKCLVSGAAKADIWRYVMIWEYGGIYTDIDNGPGPLFYNTSTNVSAINEETDALFEQEGGKFPSQYFFAASPHHPVMYYTVLRTLERLFAVENLKEQYVPFVTGPGAVKTGVISFIGDGYPTKGTYTGTHNRSVTIVGSPTEARKGLYVIRDDRTLAKRDGYNEMGIVRHGTKASKEGVSTESCFSVLYSLHKKEFEKDLP